MTFKVGDRVRLTGASWGEPETSEPPFIGEVVTIAGHNESGNAVFRYYDEDADSGFEDLLEIEEPDWTARKIVGIEAFVDAVTSFSTPPFNTDEIEEIQTLGNQFGLPEVNPTHYSFPSGVQTIDITRHMDFLTGNAVKYLTRAGRKGDRLTDLKKAQRYIEWAIENEESE